MSTKIKFSFEWFVSLAVITVIVLYGFYEPLRFSTGEVYAIPYIFTSIILVSGIYLFFFITINSRTVIFNAFDLLAFVFFLQIILIAFVSANTTFNALTYIRTYALPFILYFYISFRFNISVSKKMIKYLSFAFFLVAALNIYQSICINLFNQTMFWYDKYCNYSLSISLGTAHLDQTTHRVLNYLFIRVSGMLGYNSSSSFISLMGFFSNLMLFQYRKQKVLLLYSIICMISVFLLLNKTVIVLLFIGLVFYKRYIVRKSIVTLISEHKLISILLFIVASVGLKYLISAFMIKAGAQYEYFVAFKEIPDSIIKFYRSISPFALFIGGGINLLNEDAAIIQIIFCYGLLGLLLFFFFSYFMAKSLARMRLLDKELYENSLYIFMFYIFGFIGLFHRDAILHIQVWAILCALLGVFSVNCKHCNASAFDRVGDGNIKNELE